MPVVKKVLVTGGAGYIGSHTVVELIESGFTPVIIDNFIYSDGSLLPGIKKITGVDPIFLKGDCADKSFLASVFTQHPDISAVMHFAALKSVGESVQKPLLYYRNNIDSLLSLLEIMPEFNVRDFIFSSSCTVYGQPDRIPVDETAPFKPAESPYGATKQMCEQILKDAHRLGFRIISLRYFNPIGAHPSALIGETPFGGPPNALVPYLVETAAGIREKLIVFGNDYDTPDGSCIRDYIHVTDLAKAHIKAREYLTQQKGDTFYEFFNLGSGKGSTVLELIETFIRVTGIQLPYEIGARRPGDVEKVYANPAKANKMLGWKTTLSIEDALRHAWAWQQKLSVR